MPIGKALLLKGLGGLAALGGAIGGSYSLYDYYSNQETKFDRGLIDFLEADDSTNIQFSVKKVNGSSSDVDANIFQNFSDTTLAVTIKVSVNATTAGTNEGTLTEKSDAKEGSKAKKSYLQNLNKGSAQGATGNAWTWECKIVFEKPTTATGTELKDKDKLVKSSDPKGFFDKLKDTDANNKHKDLKIKFIKDCAAARGTSKNRKINKKKSLDSNKIESTKTFKLIDNSETTKKLIPENQSDFDHWFKNVNN